MPFSEDRLGLPYSEKIWRKLSQIAKFKISALRQIKSEPKIRQIKSTPKLLRIR